MQQQTAAGRACQGWGSHTHAGLVGSQAARRRAKLLKAAAPPPFVINPMQAEVKAGEKLELQVTFQPANKGPESNGAWETMAAPPLEEPFGYMCQLRAEG